jgi:hypothetical protein
MPMIKFAKIYFTSMLAVVFFASYISGYFLAINSFAIGSFLYILGVFGFLTCFALILIHLSYFLYYSCLKSVKFKPHLMSLLYISIIQGGYYVVMSQGYFLSA